MESKTLTDLAEKELDDLVERYNFLTCAEEWERADAVLEKGMSLSEAIDNNDTFFCLPYLGDLNPANNPNPKNV